SDVYALGLIGYECLTGHPAFEGDNAVTIALKQVRQDPEPLPENLPAEVRELIGRALAKDPATRFPDGAAFVAAIDDVQAGRSPAGAPTTTVPPGVVPPPRPAGPETALTEEVTRPPAGRRRGRVAMVLLPLLGLLAGAGIAVALLQALAGDPAGSPSVAAEQRDSGSIVLDADEYIGRPVDEVVARLTRLGLDVQPRGEARDDVVPDQVTDVRPHGEPLSPGDTVVVTYSTGPASGDGRTNRPAVTGAAGGGDTTVAEEETPPTVVEEVPQSTSGPTPPTRTATSPTTMSGTTTSSQASASQTSSETTGSQGSASATTSAESPATSSPAE
ncbi:PASTA domain-containing protein, partial [Blastococcus deserti]